MKILAILILMLVPSFVNAQCLMVSPAPAQSGYVRVCTYPLGVEAACDNSQGLYWVPYQGGTASLTSDTIDTCSGYWISSAADTRNYQAVEITPENFALAFGFGVTAVLTFWFLPYVGSVAGNVIRKM
jgi:hypothetical protein